MDSTVPNSIVQLVGMSSPCANEWTSKYSSDDSFPRQILSLTESTSISAPPPGIESSPASCSLCSVCRIDYPERLEM